MPVLRRAMLILAVAIFSYMFADGINRSLQNNFFVEVLGIRPDQMGLWVSLREIPGLLTVFVTAIGMRLAPPWLGAVALLVNGIGYGSWAMVADFGSLVAVSFTASIGFHLWMPVNSALGLSIARKENAGRVLGKLQSVGSAAVLLSMILSWVLMRLVVSSVGYPVAFVLSGLVLLVGAVVMTRFPLSVAEWPKQRIVVRRRYWLYYLLNFLEGCRFQVYLAFGVYLLVQVYHVDVQTVTLLFVITSAVSIVGSPLVGRWIDLVGERRSLTVSYIASFLVFLGFALVHNANVAMVLYVFYNFLTLFVIAISTYLKRIAMPADLGPSLAMGVTTMHIPSVVVPLVGGMLWQRLGYQIPFLLAAAFILGSLIATQMLPKRQAEPTGQQQKVEAAVR